MSSTNTAKAAQKMAANASGLSEEQAGTSANQAGSAPPSQPWKDHITVKTPQAINFAGDNGNIRLIDGRVDGKVVGG